MLGSVNVKIETPNAFSQWKPGAETRYMYQKHTSLTIPIVISNQDKENNITRINSEL